MWQNLCMMSSSTNDELLRGDTNVDVSLTIRRKGGLSTIKVSIEIVFLWCDLRLRSIGFWRLRSDFNGVDIARRHNRLGLLKTDGF